MIGAEIGLFSLFAANKWHSSKIISFEPDPENFFILRENTAEYPNIVPSVPIRAAIYTHNGSVQFLAAEKPGTRRVSDKGNITVPALTLESAFKQWGEPDLIKMDVKGAEHQILKAL